MLARTGAAPSTARHTRDAYAVEVTRSAPSEQKARRRPYHYHRLLLCIPLPRLTLRHFLAHHPASAMCHDTAGIVPRTFLSTPGVGVLVLPLAAGPRGK